MNVRQLVAWLAIADPEDIVVIDTDSQSLSLRNEIGDVSTVGSS